MKMNISLMDTAIVSNINISFLEYFNQTNNLTVVPGEHYKYTQPYKDERIAFLIFLFVTTILGNSIVLGAVSVAKTSSRMTFFITHLALADLLVGCFSLLPDLITGMVGHFEGGEVLCKIIKFSQCLVTYGSTFVLVSLSIDRLDAIARPLGFSTSKTRNQILVATAWLVAALFSIPTTIIIGTDYCHMSLPSLWHWKVYVTLIAFAVFFIPAIIIAFCYGILVYIIVSKNRLLKTVGKKEISKPFYFRTGTRHSRGKISDTFNRKKNVDSRASSRGIIPKAKIRTIKMTFVIIIVFILCWSPYFVWNLLFVYGYILENPTTILLNAFVQSLAPLNSAVNPLIYGVFSTRICRQLRQYRIVTVVADSLSFCSDKSDRKSTETSATFIESYSMRKRASSTRFMSTQDNHPEICDLLKSLPEATCTTPEI